MSGMNNDMLSDDFIVSYFLRLKMKSKCGFGMDLIVVFKQRMKKAIYQIVGCIHKDYISGYQVDT